MQQDMEHLIKTGTAFKQEYIIVRPGIAVVLYFEDPLHVIGPAIAGALETYLAFIPQGTLKLYVSASGKFLPLGERQVAKTLRELRVMRPGEKFYGFNYTSSENASAGEYGVQFIGTPLDNERLPNETNVLRLEFPWDMEARVGVPALLAFVTGLAEALPFAVGTVGFSFNFSVAFRTESRDAINALLPRYYGFEPSYLDTCEQMRGHTPSAQWVNLLGQAMLQRLGGGEACRQALPGCLLRPLSKGLLIQAAAKPPLGDVNHGACDLGCMPSVARFLRPTRFQIGGFGGSKVGFDVERWLARLDDRADGSFENR